MGSVKKVIVVGGGISGMTLAIALQQRGIATHVVEKARPEDQLGTGINLQNNALRALRDIGVLKECLAEGFGWNTVATRDARGELLDVRELPWKPEPGMPGALGIMRTTLAEILARHATDAGAKISYQTTVETIDQRTDGVTVTLSDGRTERADILVAADGAYSQIRQMAFGNDHHPLYAGQGVWRYTVPRPKTLDGFTIFRAEGGAASVGCLPLAEDLAYFFILESTVEPVRFREAELAARLSERLAPYSAPELVEARATVGEDRHISFRRFDILLMPQPWHRGRIVLLGDAAHSLTPQLTSGGGMAVEDSVVLADELDGCTDIERAFTAYGQRREGRVRPIYDNSLRICELEKGHPSDATEAVTLFVESFKLLAAHY